jgi:hypothetical protein
MKNANELSILTAKLNATLTSRSKPVAEAVNKVLMQNNPADGLQGSPTLWKLVNGMTAVARESKPERRRELEQIAGEMLTK